LQAQRFEFKGDRGLTLVAEAWGDPENKPVILAHGGGQTRHAWGGTARALAERGWYAVAYDHRGHGESEWAPDNRYKVSCYANDLATLAQMQNQPPAVVGASLGGMSAMVVAGENSERIFSSITLVDVTPRLNRQGVDNIYKFMGEHIEQGFASLEEVAETVAAYTGRPKRADYSGLKKNLRERDGRYYWHWDPGFFTFRADRKKEPNRVLDAAKKIDIPIMLVRGRMSDIVTEDEVEEFLEMLPHAQYVDVEKAKHMVAGDRNDIFTAEVVKFLGSLS